MTRPSSETLITCDETTRYRIELGAATSLSQFLNDYNDFYTKRAFVSIDATCIRLSEAHCSYEFRLFCLVETENSSHHVQSETRSFLTGCFTSTKTSEFSHREPEPNGIKRRKRERSESLLAVFENACH